VSRWLTLAGLVCAVVLLIGIGMSPWAELVFPAWILALSLDILAAGPRAPEGGIQVPLLPAETIEFSVSHASKEGVPFVRRESENRSLGVPAVANPDPAAGQARYLDAVAVGEAQRALDPVRT